MAAIECVGLSKVYDRRIVALSDVSLTVSSGASFGLLGENGAGIYIVGSTALAQWWMERRDLVLH